MQDATAYYEAKQEGLGARFLVAVQDAVNRVRARPGMFPLAHGDARRCRTRIFPYGVVYRIVGDSVAVLAVMHLRRDPGHWHNRSGTPDEPA
ncbi:MAG: type II toxin-antitoxin system RelE/ParE family toxin [Armatimonadetes bacterium]|nr:type II toxin-antitoxin system RelE/ParE family toxin [Armatimonadota bacterium]